MKTRIFDDITVYFVSPVGSPLRSEQDALDLLGETYGTETDLIAVPAGRFAQSFFDLSTKEAGHFFQKLQNYQMRLAIIGDISVHTANSKALRDFVGETNRIGHHLFVRDEAGLAVALEQKV